ncbi:MAG TPA: NAD(P)H-binding protein [Gillisia sp.]|nr:NAD(P)H-binding protein [Gillisia sp.]
MAKTAIILGATGLTGGILLQQLLQDPRYGKIKLFGRSSVAVKDIKIEEHLVDLFEPDSYEYQFTGDEVFCCIGTTKNKTPDEETYRKIDRGIPVSSAILSRKNNIPTFVVISALGANKNSKMFYNRIKGEMEAEVLAQDIPNTYIFQPSLIAGDRVESRPWEKLAMKVMKMLNPIFVGGMKKYRSIHPETIAKAMILVANEGYPKNRIISEEIKQIVENGN